MTFTACSECSTRLPTDASICPNCGASVGGRVLAEANGNATTESSWQPHSSRPDASAKHGSLTDEEWRLLRCGRKLEAVKSIKQRLLLPLMDAKRLVEDAQAASSVSGSKPAPLDQRVEGSGVVESRVPPNAEMRDETLDSTTEIEGTGDDDPYIRLARRREFLLSTYRQHRENLAIVLLKVLFTLAWALAAVLVIAFILTVFGVKEEEKFVTGLFLGSGPWLLFGTLAITSQLERLEGCLRLRWMLAHGIRRCGTEIDQLIENERRCKAKEYDAENNVLLARTQRQFLWGTKVATLRIATGLWAFNVLVCLVEFACGVDWGVNPSWIYTLFKVIWLVVAAVAVMCCGSMWHANRRGEL